MKKINTFNETKKILKLIVGVHIKSPDDVRNESEEPTTEKRISFTESLKAEALVGERVNTAYLSKSKASELISKALEKRKKGGNNNDDRYF